MREVISYILAHYFDYIEDIVPSLQFFVEEEMVSTINLFSQEISFDKRKYIVEYIEKVNSEIQELLPSRKPSYGGH